MKYCLSLTTEEGLVYYNSFTKIFPVPRVGEKIFVGGEAMGFWTVESIYTSLPSAGALVPAFGITILVKWSESNEDSAPVYDEDRGWVRA